MASEASAAEGGASATEAPDEAATLAPAPHGLRLGRALVGVVLLVLAWGAVMGAFLLASAALAAPPGHSLASQLALDALGIIGALWLAIMALAAIIVGAFCLMLAVTTRQW
jgi:hypothetical protein